MKKNIKIVKIGGGIIDNENDLKDFLEKFHSISGCKILVHGGGKGANQILTKLGIQPNMQNGRRITDKETLDVVVQLYAGLYNKSIVSQLQALGCNAIGLSGADGHSILSKLRKKEPIDYGFVGDPQENGINQELFSLLLINNYSPVCCAITMDEKGQLLNTNADTIASSIAIALSNEFDVQLTYCFDKIGVLEDVNIEDSLISKINTKSYQKLLENGTIADGMKPKLENAFLVIKKGVNSVRLCHAKNLTSEIGTIIKDY